MAKKRLATPKLRSTATQQQSEYSESITPLNLVDDNEIEEADLEKLSEIVQNANEAVSQHLLSALEAALIAGKALLAAKELFNYDRGMGGFKGWVESQELSRATAYRYMTLAEFSEVVSEAKTLSEANKLITEYKATSKSIKPNPPSTTMRTTLRFEGDSYSKLKAIAAREGVDAALLIENCVNRWLKRQKIDQETIDVEAASE